MDEDKPETFEVAEENRVAGETPDEIEFDSYEELVDHLAGEIFAMAKTRPELVEDRIERAYRAFRDIFDDKSDPSTLAECFVGAICVAAEVLTDDLHQLTGRAVETGENPIEQVQQQTEAMKRIFEVMLEHYTNGTLMAAASAEADEDEEA